TGPCSVRLRPAPPAEVAARLASIRERIAPVGGRAKIEMTALGDRASRITWQGATAGSQAPRTEEEARTRVIDVLTPVADVLGLESSELGSSARTPTRPGVRWEMVHERSRDPDLDLAPVRLGTGSIITRLDRHGRLLGVEVGPGLLPPLTLCDAVLDRAAIERAVVGVPLEWDSSDGRKSEATVKPGELRSFKRSAMITGALEPAGGQVDVAVVYVVSVRRGRLPFTIRLAADTATVIDVDAEFFD
ncbi:MAG: hypothetical protein H0T42_02535, partial [Deltaproteobacteria bacterium]|nr:hypothetical protein [Deltaproteobacteria bacterium]